MTLFLVMYLCPNFNLKDHDHLHDYEKGRFLTKQGHLWFQFYLKGRTLNSTCMNVCMYNIKNVPSLEMTASNSVTHCMKRDADFSGYL